MVDMLTSFFNPAGGYEEAQNKVRDAWKQQQEFLNPYNQAGKGQISQLQGAENKLLSPEQLESQWAQNYQTSPYAQQLMQQNKAQGLDAASSMGLMGSSAALGNIQQGAGNIMNKDRQQYMHDLMEKYMAGLGIGKTMYGGGLQSAGQLANQAQQYGNTMGGLAAKEYAAPGQMFGNLLGTAARIGAAFI